MHDGIIRTGPSSQGITDVLVGLLLSVFGTSHRGFGTSQLPFKFLLGLASSRKLPKFPSRNHLDCPPTSSTVKRFGKNGV